jgi:outer membrane murein-binding lipoprotein Lpp
MNRRHLVAAAAVLLGVLAVAGCTSMDAKDQAVIDRLEKLDIVTIPAGATKMSSTQAKGGGSDVVAIRGASSVLVVYASPLPAARVMEFYRQTYDKSWDLRISAAAGSRSGEWKGIGANRSDSQTNVTIDARPPAVNDKAPAGTKSVVSVSVSATRE